MTAEKQTYIASKLYESRRLLRSLMPDYNTRIVEYMRIIDGLATEAGGHLSAGLQVAKELSAKGHESSLPWIFAATVELIEPDGMTVERSEKP